MSDEHKDGGTIRSALWDSVFQTYRRANIVVDEMTKRDEEQKEEQTSGGSHFLHTENEKTRGKIKEHRAV